VLDYDIKSSMMGSMQTMMMFAAVIMVIVLFLVYPVRARLLPLIVIFMAVIATVGLMGWLNIGLTMVSMAVFPVLIGLGIDYSIQMQSRYEEVYTRGEQDA
jgi:predicted RND superfamily exporter protein